MSKIDYIVYSIGWFFILLSFVWPKQKWGGYAIRTVFSAVATGIFVAGMVYVFLS
jgi:hypothetical protein